MDTLEDRKAEDILLLDIHETSDFTDYFIICTGTTDRMINALADAVVDKVRDVYRLKGRREGEAQEGWLLLDFGDIVVHLFAPERREYYRLEELWSQGRVLLHLQ